MTNMTENTDGPNVAVFPPFAALGALVVAVALEWVAPFSLLPPPLTWIASLLAAVLIVGSFGLAFTAITAFRRGETNVDVRKPALTLVETGPFRLTRNPMYVGMIALLLGLCLLFSLDWVIVLAPALWAALHFGAVLREEAYLTRKFGAPYEAFLSRTRRWL
jgi:protein-S-isoprenylcysteine O-methyltransferase Ste14